MYVGIATALAVSRTNDYFVTEAFTRQILRFDSAGTLVEAMGRGGRGPDEFERPTEISAMDDSTLLVADDVRQDLVLWDLVHNRARKRLRYEGIAGSLAVGGGRILSTVFNFRRHTMAVQWTAPYDTPTYFGKLPAYTSKHFGQAYGTVAVSTYNDTVAYVAGDSDVVRIANANWTVIDSIPIPRRIRRGVPAHLDTSLSGGRNIYSVMNQLSVLWGVYRLSGNRFAIAHLDGNAGANGVGSVIYFTVVSKGGASRCVDVPIPTHWRKIQPLMMFKGDSLYVLDQYSPSNDSTRAVTDISKYIIGQDIC